jgi:monomeric sarcosine oxidase
MPVAGRAAIVGAGIMGLATARALARRGWDVTIYEQFEVGHKRGSSHGRSRIFRLAYPDPQWVRLATDALHGWRDLEEESGAALLELNGLLEVVKDATRSSRNALQAAGGKFELMRGEEAQRRWPIRVPDNWTVLFQPEAGIVRADLAQRAFLDSALAHGADLQEKTLVEWPDDLDADVTVVTAGAWVRRLVPRVSVRPTRETLAYFRRDGSAMPSVGQLDPETRGHAQYSLRDPRYGLKAGVHHAGREVDPDEPGEPDPELVTRIADWVARLHTDVDPEPIEAETCLYTNTDDERFILERHGRIVVGSACSGHGFKFAPVVGERLAALAAGTGANPKRV